MAPLDWFCVGLVSGTAVTSAGFVLDAWVRYRRTATAPRIGRSPRRRDRDRTIGFRRDR